MRRSNHVVKYYADVTSKKVRWLWYPYIPYGKITLLQGDPGDGKSTLALYLTACLTSGAVRPDGQANCSPESVIYQCEEDGKSDTIRPRLMALKADCRRVAFIEQDAKDPLTLDDSRIASAIKETKAKLLIIDPIQDYMRDLNQSDVVRKMLTKLDRTAEKTGCAILLIGHLNKRQKAKALYRNFGSIDFIAVCRSVLLVKRLNSHSAVRYLSQIKNSLEEQGPDYAFEIPPDGGINMIGPVSIEEEADLDLEASMSKQDLAGSYLLEWLKEQDLPCVTIYERLKEKNISVRTIDYSKKKYGIKSVKKADGWYWHLPDETEDINTDGGDENVGTE